MRWCKENVKKDEDEAGEEQGKKRVSCVSFGRDRNGREKKGEYMYPGRDAENV